MMKNFKIGKKLTIAFGIIGVLFVSVVIMSISSLMNTGTQFTSFYDNGYKITNTSMDMRRAIQSACKNIGYAIMTDDEQQTKEFIDALTEDAAYLSESINTMKDSFQGEQSLITDCISLLEEGSVIRKQVSELALVNQNEQATELFFDSYRPILTQIQNKLVEINEAAGVNADTNYGNSKTAETTALIILCVLSAVALIVMVILSVYITRSLTRPINEIEEAARQMAEGGLNATITYQSKDELGSLSNSMRTLINGLSAIVKDIDYLLGEMASGNFRIKTKSEESYIGDYLPILHSMRNINSSLSNTLTQISQSSDQVASGSDQVSSGAQALSQGATEQASSVEELAATINEISSQVKETAKNAKEAREQTAQSGDEVSICNQQMDEMIGAMDDISRKSSEIGKIIKTIEDIAFQTNILALNAAVEAARAGTAGKGFAVVADEVRSLASKSAEASKNTAALIEGSVDAVEKGTKIANETAQSLSHVVEGTTRIAATVDKIADAAAEQATSIAQVTQGVDQISSVVQTNSATAEESAAASEELSGQAQMLKNLVGKFKLHETGEVQPVSQFQQASAKAAPAGLQSGKY